MGRHRGANDDYDVVLKFVARHPGCTHGDVEAHVRAVSPETAEQVGGYLKILLEKYRMVEKRLPIFAAPRARRSRYYIRDNFLRAWLDALSSPVSALNFRPEEILVDMADERLASSEGYGFERLVAQLYEERARKGIGDFSLTHRIQGYWDRSDTEIDLVALDEDSQIIRFGTCKRSSGRLLSHLAHFDSHIARFLTAHPRYASWRVEKAALAPALNADERANIDQQGYLPQDLRDLTADLRSVTAPPPRRRPA